MRSERRGSKENVRQPLSSAGDFSFRRSRTITGTTSSEVKTVGETRSQLKSPRLHEHTLRRHRRRLAVYLLLSLALCGVLWYAVSSYVGTRIAVKVVARQSQLSVTDTPKYQSLVNQYLNEHPFERFQFSLNESSLSAYITAKAGEVASAELTKGNGIGSGDLLLAFRQPVVSWTIKGGKYFVDASGNIYTVNYFSEPAVTVADKSGLNADAGIIASNKLLRFIGRVVTLVNASGVGSIEQVELPPNSTREVDFKLAGKNYPLKANLDRDPAGQALDIENAVKYVTAKQITPQYLDLRVSSKAYYRN